MPKKVVEQIPADPNEVPERVWGAKKPKKPVMFEPVEVKEPIDWEDLSFKMTWADYHELRKQHGLD